MSPAFIAAIGETFPNAAVTVDWFHVVQLFTMALDEVRRAEARNNKLPKALRWAILKKSDGKMTEAQAEALAELEASDLLTAIAWRLKEKLRWVRKADTVQAARARVRGYRNVQTFITMIYLIIAPLGDLFKST
ncbi:transposase (fragment) [Magnetospirillum sp. SS-4]